MYDMKPLEEEWKKYRQKKMSPWYLGFFSIFVLAIIFTIFFNGKIEWKFLKKYMPDTSINIAVSFRNLRNKRA